MAIGFRPLGAQAQAPASEGAALNPLAAYVAITEADRVTIISSQFDMGQGSYHGIATLAVEELGARWDQVAVVGGAGNVAAYGNLAWGGLRRGPAARPRWRPPGSATGWRGRPRARCSWRPPPSAETCPPPRSRCPRARCATPTTAACASGRSRRAPPRCPAPRGLR